MGSTSKTDEEAPLGEIAALVSALCWAGTSVALARLGTKYGGAVLSGLRFLIASPFAIVLFFATDAVNQVRHAPWIAIGAVLLSGVFNYLVGDTAYVRALPRVGLQRMSPTATALWVALSTLGGVLILHEPAGLDLLVGGASVIVGTFLVVSGQVRRLHDPDGPPRIGALPALGLLLLVAGSWATSTLLIAGGRDGLGPIAVNAIRIPAGGLMIATMALVTTRGEVLKRLPEPRDIPLVLAVGILGTALGSLAYVYAVAEAGAARAVILNSTSPLMVVPLSMVFLGERPTMRVGVGTVFCLAGTLIVVAAG
ncbi:MAG: DMT family transporter [Chloroflexota bacterium]